MHWYFSKVVDFRHPKDLEGLLDLDIGQSSTSDSKLVAMAKQIVKYSVKSGEYL